MKVEEFYRLPETNRLEELIAGEYILIPLPYASHQHTLGNLLVFLYQSASQGTTVLSPSAIVIDADNILEPDIFWIRPEGDCKLVDERYWQGAPDLVIEVLSPSTAKRDRGVKFDVYERHGVREYWLIDLEAQFVEVYRHEGGAFKRQGLYGADESFTSAVLGIEVKAAAIFAV